MEMFIKILKVDNGEAAMMCLGRLVRLAGIENRPATGMDARFRLYAFLKHRQKYRQ